MAGRRLETLDAREIIRRLRAGETDRAISRALGVARRTAARYRELARERELMTGPLPSPKDLDELLV